MSSTSVAANLNNIVMLNGTNLKDWKENITILLGCMDLDLALREPKPDAITATSSESDQVYKGTWEHSNRLSLMIIHCDIPEVFRGIVTGEISSAKDYLAEFEKRFVENDKAKTSELLANLISVKYSGKGNVREHIMEISQLASKLKALKLELSENLLVHLVLISLPSEYSQCRNSYNYQREKWSLNELISFRMEEEEMLKHDKAANSKAPVFNTHVTCHFCEETRHVKKKCPKWAKYIAWRVKRGLPELPMTCDAERCIYLGIGHFVTLTDDL
ncbi:unnamed protein product [Rhodiola kirilowii]